MPSDLTSSGGSWQDWPSPVHPSGSLGQAQLTSLEPRLTELEDQIRRSHPPTNSVRFWRAWQLWADRIQDLVGPRARNPLLRSTAVHELVWNHLFVVFDNRADELEGRSGKEKP